MIYKASFVICPTFHMCQKYYGNFTVNSKKKVREESDKHDQDLSSIRHTKIFFDNGNHRYILTLIGDLEKHTF